jgi:hypothetical protein
MEAGCIMDAARYNNVVIRHWSDLEGIENAFNLDGLPDCAEEFESSASKD